MKKWLIPLVGLSVALATVTGVGLGLVGDEAGAPEPIGADLPIAAAMCADEVPECNDTVVFGSDVEGANRPDIGNDGLNPIPDRDVVCGQDQSVAVTSEGQVSCADYGGGTGMAGDETGGQVVEPLPPVAAVTGISDGQASSDIPVNEFSAVFLLAREDLSQRLFVETGSITLAEIERAWWPIYWPEEPEPGVAYIEIALEGFRLVLEADGRTYSYETDTSERVLFVG